MVTIAFELFWVMAFLFAFWHLSKQQSARDALVFFIPALLWGFIVESTSVKLYNLYYYPVETYLFSLFNTPIAVAFGWATIIYFGFFITTKKLFVKKALNIDIETAVISTGIDFIILEPLAFFYKFWIWKQNDFWFGAPLFNFIGWFMVISVFVASYNFVKKKFRQDRIKQVSLLLVLLSVGLIVLRIITELYLTLFGWF